MSILLELHNNHYALEESLALKSSVTAHTEYLRYNKYTDSSSTHLTYFESSLQTAEKNIQLHDLSDLHPINNLDYITSPIEQLEGVVFKSRYRDILVTNMVSNTGVPLFYKHKTKWASEPEVTKIQEGKVLASAEVEEAGHFFINGYWYNNYKNKYDYASHSYEIFFLTGFDSEGNPATEILSNESAISEFSWRDIGLGVLDGGAPINNSFTRTRVGNSFEYHVVIAEASCEFNNDNNIYVKYLNSNSIRLNKPTNLNQKDSWFASISNGLFFTTKKYFVPEYDYQNFNPEYGILKNFDKECFVLNKFNNGCIIKTNHTDILLKPEVNLNITIKVLNENEEVIKIFTSEETLIGTEYNDNVNYRAGVESIDGPNGLIALSEEIYSEVDVKQGKQVVVRATFHTEAKDYIYSKLDLNPLFNKDILKYKYYFYLRPDADRQESIFWLKCNHEDIVIDFYDPGFDDQDTSILRTTLSSFKTNYCYGSNNNHQFLELGEIFYKENDYVDEAITLDIRDSTAVNEKTFDEFIYRQHKVLQSDYGYGESGQVYQDANIVVVDLPKELLVKNGGSYSEKELYELLKLKTSPGLEIIFNWDVHKPSLQLHHLSNEEIVNQDRYNENKAYVEFSVEGPGVYKIYRITDDTMIFDLSQLEPIKTIVIDEPTAKKVYTDETIGYKTTYYYKVVYNDLYESDVVGFRTRPMPD